MVERSQVIFLCQSNGQAGRDIGGFWTISAPRRPSDSPKPRVGCNYQQKIASSTPRGSVVMEIHKSAEPEEEKGRSLLLDYPFRVICDPLAASASLSFFPCHMEKRARGFALNNISPVIDLFAKGDFLW